MRSAALMMFLLTGCDAISAANGPIGPVGPEGPAGPAGDMGNAGDPGTMGNPGVSATATALPSGDEHCANGGVRLTSGSGATYVCNGAPGPKGDPGLPGAGAALSVLDANANRLGALVLYLPSIAGSPGPMVAYRDDAGKIWTVCHGCVNGADGFAPQVALFYAAADCKGPAYEQTSDASQLLVANALTFVGNQPVTLASQTPTTFPVGSYAAPGGVCQAGSGASLTGYAATLGAAVSLPTTPVSLQ